MLLMRRILATFFLIFAVFIFNVHAKALAEIKILDLGFDNSDKIIFLNSIGELSPKPAAEDSIVQNVSITKGALKDPDRVYFDITNAALATPSKMWNFKNSSLESVKASQFSVNPHIVRLVLTHKKELKPENFEVHANNNQLVIKYTNKKIVENSEFTSIYKNFSRSGIIYNNSLSTLYVEPPPTDKLVPVSNIERGENAEIQQRLNSQYYISNVQAVQKGILIGGMGTISLKPAIFLTEPDRMVIDIDNAVLAPSLRNKSFFFEGVKVEGANVLQRDILRLGQFEKNIVRIVVQGEGAKNYRAVVSPDLQNIFVAKRPDVLNSKLTNVLSSVIAYSVGKSDGADVLGINFTAPVTFSTFEEGGNFYLDIQNISDMNSSAFENMLKNSKFKEIKTIRIAQDKLRFIIPLETKENVDLQISDDAKRMMIYFKISPKPVTSPGTITPKKDPDPIVSRPTTIKNLLKVVIDPGHGGSDVGATRENIYEKDMTLDISLMVAKNLKKQNVFVEMTREKDKTVELSERTDFSNGVNPDLFVSIHINASVKEDIYGIETHWWKENSITLAEIMHKNMTASKLLKKWDTVDRGLFKSQFYVINHTICPAVLVEVGFISNPAERKALLTKKRQEEIADAITDGIMEYLKSRR